MRITKKMITAAEDRGACSEAIDWLRSSPRTFAQLAAYERGGSPAGYYWLEWALCFRSILSGEVRKHARKLYKERSQEIGY